ncbi:hypothetical protein LXL04_027790 [Taraxacum kok-saghyz]
MEDQRIFLVYEFMPNGNFQDLLDRGRVKQLSLITKVKISVGIAPGIVYLHNTEYRHDVCKCQLHRDKILLDEDFTAKLSGYDITLLERDLGQLPTDLSGFTMLFAEYPWLVLQIKSCFEICIEVDSKLKMLRILEEYEEYIPACQKLEFTKPPIKYFLSATYS